MRIFVIRHPETEANVSKLIYGRTESPYTQRGIDSIKWVLNKLKDTKLSAVYTSPMQRTVKLASAISGQQGCPISVSEALREMDFGVFENMTRSEVEGKHREHYEDYMANYTSYRIPEGESFQDVYARLSAFLKPLLLEEGMIALVTHGMVMKAAIAILLGLSADTVWHFSTIPATILEIEYRDDYGVLIELTAPEEPKPENILKPK